MPPEPDQWADREAPRLVEQLGVEAGEQRRRARLVLGLTFMVALVLELERVVPLEGPTVARRISELELQAVVLARAVVAGGPQLVRERPEVDAVLDHGGDARAAVHELLDEVAHVAVGVDGLEEPRTPQLHARGGR